MDAEASTPTVVTRRAAANAKPALVTPKLWEAHRTTDLTVRWTNDYDVFTFVSENRNIAKEKDDDHVQRLASQISERGFRPELAIHVEERPDGKLAVMNGQHRLLACRLLGVEIAYLVLTSSHEQAMHDVRTDHLLTKGWKLNDFMRSFAASTDPLYQSYRDVCAFATKHGFIDKQGLPLPADVLKLFLYKSDEYRAGRSRLGKYFTDSIKLGNFALKPIQHRWADEAMYMVDKVRLEQPIAKAFSHHTPFLHALCDFVTHQLYDPDRMEEALLKRSSRLVRCSSVRDYLLSLQSVYNPHLKPDRVIILAE